MESSSENSFAWADTSSDSFDSNSISTDTNIKNNINDLKQHDMIQKESKLPKLNAQDDFKMSVKKEQSFNENISFEKKSIKQEPDSDYDVPKKKKKLNQSQENGSENNFEEPMRYDESYLDMKLKLEEANTKTITKFKHKKNNHVSSQETCHEKTNDQVNISEISLNGENDAHLKQENENESMNNKAKKKKKKSKKRCHEGDDLVEEDKNIKALVRQNVSECVDTSVAESNISQESYEDSGCNEISAIKCDDDHNLHAISFTNKSLQKDKYDMINEKLTNHKLSGDSETTVQQRTPRISDRIRFEDEDDDSNLESTLALQKSKSSSKLKKFTHANPKLKQVSNNLLHNLRLSQNCEIWIMKCPKQIDSSDFTNTSLKVDSKCKIKVGGQSYESNVEDGVSDSIALITRNHNKYHVHNLPVSGIIQLKKRIPKAHYRDDNVMENNQTNFIPLPEIKCRHPLFGPNYKKAIKIPSAIAERLNNQHTEEPSVSTEKYKKKKPKKDKSTEKNYSCIEHDSAIESQALVETKKKKRKAVQSEGPAPKKAKHIKHESTNVWDSEKAIEENLFNF